MKKEIRISQQNIIKAGETNSRRTKPYDRNPKQTIHMVLLRCLVEAWNWLERDRRHILQWISYVSINDQHESHTFFLYLVVTLVASTPFLTLLVIR